MNTISQTIRVSYIYFNMFSTVQNRTVLLIIKVCFLACHADIKLQMRGILYSSPELIWYSQRLGLPPITQALARDSIYCFLPESLNIKNLKIGNTVLHISLKYVLKTMGWLAKTTTHCNLRSCYICCSSCKFLECCSSGHLGFYLAQH